MNNKRFVIKLIIIGFIILFAFTLHQFIFANQEISQETSLQYNNTNNNRPLNYISGKVSKDTFPEINNPQYITADKAASFLKDSDDIYFFNTGNKVYVYPASILSYHHIVNDVINNKPVAVTLCLLSASANVFDRKYNNTLYSFGVLGPLYFGNLVMYDKTSNSYWTQINGELLEGKSDIKKLTNAYNLEETKWKYIKDNFSIQQIFVLPPVKDINFYNDFYAKFKSSYLGLRSTTGTGVKIDSRSSGYKEGLGITVHGSSTFYPLDTIQTKKVINDNIGGWGISIVYNPILHTYSIFRRFLNGKELTFNEKDGLLYDNETDSQWNFNGEAVKGPLKGKILQIPSFTQVYWFSWSSFYPNTSIYK